MVVYENMEGEIVSLILSGVIAFATVCYTIINLMMWFESRATRNQKVKPQIIPYLKSSDSHDILCLYIKNVGEGCAKDVHIKVLKDYPRMNKEGLLLSNLPIFREGVNVFPSGYELHYNLNWWKDISNDGLDDSIELEIICKDLLGKVYGPYVYKLEFNQIKSTYMNPPETYIGQIAYYLSEIHKDIKVVKK